MNSKTNNDTIDKLLTSLFGREKAIVEGSDAAAALGRFIAEIPGGFLIYRADDNRILYVNDALLSIYKCATREEFYELTGNSFEGMVHPDDVEGVQKTIFEQIESNHDDLDYVEYRIIRKDGAVRWVEDYGHFVHSETAGDIFYVFISDATEKINRRFELIDSDRKKEKKLRTLIEEYDKERKLISQEHLQRLEVIEGLSVNYESICYADLDADLILPYRLSSRLEKQFEKKLQVKPLRWFLRDYAETWVHADDRARFTSNTSPEYIRKKLAESKTYYLNYRCIKDGETQFIQLRMVNVGENARVGKLVMGFRKVDDEIMQEMKQRQLLQDALNAAKLADAAKNAFLSNMSHDMRTPLNAIFGYTELARKNADDREALLSYLDKIERSGRQMLGLVEKVLDFSYVKSAVTLSTSDLCSISAVVEDILDGIKPRAEHKNIKITTDVNITHDKILTDAERFKQMFAHIADNAVKYTGEGGRVEITAIEKEGATEEYASYAFTVKDNGIGIDPDHLDRIFDPFEREYNTTHGGEYGAGLGLPIAKRIAESMNGNISVESELGKGSTFTVTLGFALPCEEYVKQEPPKLSSTGKKILLVDDNEINVDIEAEILEDLGFDVDIATNGKEALDKVTASVDAPYDVVLMDIQMPIMDGREAAKAIRALENGKLASVPIIAVSANAFESDKLESMACGMNAHLSKPIDEAVLLDAISKVCIK